MSWHVYKPGEEVDVLVGEYWQRARFVNETMSPSHKGIVEFVDGGERREVTRDALRPVGAPRGRLN